MIKFIDNGISRSDYHYNSRNLLTSETQTISGQSPRTVSYHYDADGLRIGLDYPSGVAIDNKWTALGQLETVSADGPPPLATYSYDKAERSDLLVHEHDRRLVGRVDCPAGSPVRGEFAMRGQIHQNGITQARQYDAASQLLNITHIHNGVIQSGHGYGYDNAGRRTSETFLNGGTPARTYSYDAASQVTAADYGAGQTDSFNYDAMGNRTSATIASQGGGTFNYGSATTANQYTSITGRSAITHDANGNQLLNGAGAAFTWDSENRLLTVTPVSPNLGDKAHVHSYDGLHRRVTRTTREWTSSGWTNLETTYFIYDGWNVIEEWTSTFSPATAATLTRRLTWGQDLAGSPSLQGAGGVGGLLMVEEITSTTNEAYHFHYDGNGNVTEITDHLGVSVATYRYDAFGNTLVATGTYAATNRYRFSTKPLDHEVTTAPLYYYGYRHYDPVTGRWPSRDPIDERGGVNLYGFVGNDGVNGVDFLGQYKTRAEAVEAAVDLVGNSTKASREKGLKEFNGHFNENATWRTFINPDFYWEGLSKDYRVYRPGRYLIDQDRFYWQNGFVGIIFGVEYGVAVFCCDSADGGKEWKLNQETRGSFPALRSYQERSVLGQVMVDLSPPHECTNPALSDKVHSHNVGFGYVREAGLEDYIINAEGPSPSDVANLPKGVQGHVVTEEGGQFNDTPY